MRIVLDTNVLVSAMLFGGRLHHIIDLLLRGAIVPCFSYSSWREFERFLHHPHLQAALERGGVSPEELLSRLEIAALIFRDTKSPYPIPEDPDDEAILACAYTANVTAVVTGDKHILNLAPKSVIPIVTPLQFQRMVKNV